MMRYVLVRDYGSHTVQDSIHEDEYRAAVALDQLWRDYKKEGRAVHFLEDGSVYCASRKSTVRLYLEPRTGFIEVNIDA
jgi:hypothetical protein